ncbi:MAG: CinA family protein [Salinivirgaceae bacterium]|nr:CinA family protein [Salinivirgaceae bacterium]
MDEQKTIAAEIGEVLLRRGQTMATAESCTGGNIAHQVTLVPGSSAWFRGGVVSYTNDVKMNVLQVPRELIDRYTEVSTQVAEAMAKGVRLITGADFAVSTTGIAGPTGATDNNPVGTVCIGVATPHKVVSARLVFGSDRQSNIDSFTDAALRMLLDNIGS